MCLSNGKWWRVSRCVCTILVADGAGWFSEKAGRAPIERLKPYERNPRKNDKAVDQIRASIREFGFAVPILAKSDGEVTGGHLRLKGAIAETMREVPVIPCDGWTEAQVKAFQLMVIAHEPDGRNRVLLTVLYVGGVRVSEACGLRSRNLQTRGDAGQILVHGKGGRTRAVMLPTAVWGQLSRSSTSKWISIGPGGNCAGLSSNTAAFCEAKLAELPTSAKPVHLAKAVPLDESLAATSCGSTFQLGQEVHPQARNLEQGKSADSPFRERRNGRSAARRAPRNLSRSEMPRVHHTFVGPLDGTPRQSRFLE